MSCGTVRFMEQGDDMKNAKDLRDLGQAILEAAAAMEAARPPHFATPHGDIAITIEEAEFVQYDTKLQADLMRAYMEGGRGNLRAVLAFRRALLEALEARLNNADAPTFTVVR